MTTQESPPPGGHDLSPTPAAPPAKLRPARTWYLAALAVLLAGAAWLIVGLVTTSGKVNSFQRVALPGSGEVTLTHSGGYVIYYEGRGAASGNVPDFNLRVIPASASAAVQSLKPYTADVTYTFGSREGRAVLTLQIASPGRFLLAAPRAPAVAGGSALAVGASITPAIAITAVVGALLILAGICGLVVIAVVRHSRAKRARALAPQI